MPVSIFPQQRANGRSLQNFGSTRARKSGQRKNFGPVPHSPFAMARGKAFRGSDDCEECRYAVGLEGYECERNCCDYEPFSTGHQLCLTNCRLSTREGILDRCVNSGRCPDVVCPKPKPPPTPCEGCMLRCEEKSQQCQWDFCQNKQGDELALCQNECELARYNCIEDECFASGMCCEQGGDPGYPPEPSNLSDPTGPNTFGGTAYQLTRLATGENVQRLTADQTPRYGNRFGMRK